MKVSDINIIKQKAMAYTDQNTYLVVDGAGVSDMNARPVTAIAAADAFKVTDFVKDESPPTLTDFYLNM